MRRFLVSLTVVAHSPVRAVVPFFVCYFWTLHVKQIIHLLLWLQALLPLLETNDTTQQDGSLKLWQRFLNGQSRCQLLGRRVALTVAIISIHPIEVVHPSGACSFTAVWVCRRSKQQHNLNRHNFACLLVEMCFYSQPLNVCMYCKVLKEPRDPYTKQICSWIHNIL